MNTKVESDYAAVKEVYRAARSVRKLRTLTDPNRLPLQWYLGCLERDLLCQARALQTRLDEESGT